MSVQTHEKYKRLIDAALAEKPVTTAVAHPCDESSLTGAIDAAKMGSSSRSWSGPRRRSRSREGARPRHLEIAALRYASQPLCGGEGGRARPRRQGRGADEGKPAHRRADGRRGQARNGTAHGTSHQPLLRSRCAQLRCADHHFGRRRQHRSHAGRQGPHRSERDRSRSRDALQGGSGRDPFRDGDRESEHPFHDRGGGALQDGRPRTDHGRHPRRPARAR